MNLFTKWSEPVRTGSPLPTQMPGAAVKDLVKELLAHYNQLWWSRDRAMVHFSTPAYTSQQQSANEKRLESLANGLVYEIKHAPQMTGDRAEERAAWQERLRAQAMPFVRDVLNLEQRHLDFIESSGMLEASQEFARMARRFDPEISGDDIYQAGRNVMTMNFMQLLLGLPVEVTPSVFAYSMLYPYTDNYLDDPAISATTKLAFNHRFQERLEGEAVRPANPHEARISELVGMIEEQWPRARYPQLYESLLAIHAAQVRSLKLVAPGASPFEFDVLGISFEKGGTSVLADGYLVAGDLTYRQAEMMFGYGAFTQLMDDLEDLREDMREGRMTIFSQTAGHWPLDGVTSRVFHFGRAIFNDLSAFNGPAVPMLKEIMEHGIDPILIDILGRSGQYYSRAYLKEMERHMAFRFGALKKQREKLDRQKVSLARLIETFLLD